MHDHPFRATCITRTMSSMRFLATLVLAGVLVGLSAPHAAVAATSFTVAPLILNEKGKPRDIIKGTLTITNTTERKIGLYASVYDFDPAAGPDSEQLPPGANKEGSLANWFEISRGVIELEPQESVQVPYLIHINLKARPGIYHALLTFGAGSNRVLAQGSKDLEEIVLTVEVEDDARERLQLSMFLPDEQIFSGTTATFTYNLENVGNRTLIPRGEIRIYNRRGQEVATLSANEQGSSIAPNSRQHLASAWDASGRFGKYKAFLDVEYGQTGTVQDTVYFWVFPWREVMIGFFLLLVLIGSVTYLVHLKLTYRFAYAGAASPRSYGYDEDDEQDAGGEYASPWEDGASVAPAPLPREHHVALSPTRAPQTPAAPPPVALTGRTPVRASTPEHLVRRTETNKRTGPADGVHTVALGRSAPPSDAHHVVHLSKRS